MQEVTGVAFRVESAPRRAGDPAMLVSDNTAIKTKMHWTPKYDNLALVCQSAFEWENR